MTENRVNTEQVEDQKGVLAALWSIGILSLVAVFYGGPNTGVRAVAVVGALVLVSFVVVQVTYSIKVAAQNGHGWNGILGPIMTAVAALVLVVLVVVASEQTPSEPAAARPGESPVVNKRQQEDLVRSVERAKTPDNQKASPSESNDAEILSQMETLRLQAKEAAQSGNHADAEQALIKALSIGAGLKVGRIELHGGLTRTLASEKAALGKIDEAIKVLHGFIEHAAGQNRGDTLEVAAAADLAGIILGNNTRFAETIPYFEQAIRTKKKINSTAIDVVASMARLAISHIRLGDAPTAQKVLTEAKGMLSGQSTAEQTALEQITKIEREYGL